MMNNPQIAQCFEEMAVLLELAGENPFRIRAYQRAAQVIGGLPQAAAQMPPEELLEIAGIGKGIVAHIQELCKRGAIADLEKLRKRFPTGLLELIKVPGLGPKRAKLLFDRLKIDSLLGLEDAIKAGKLKGIPGFGEKLEQKILQGISFSKTSGNRVNHWEAKMQMEQLLEAMRGCPGILQMSPAGSLRRGRESVGDLDLLCAAKEGERTIDFFTRLPTVERVEAAGATKATVWLRSQIQCDLRVVPLESFGAALQYFTGSKDHNVALRELALKKGLTINEYGLFRLSDKKHAKPLAGRTEEEIYKRLGMDYIPPELRENRGEIQAAQKHQLPELVTLKDIRGDFHNHSTYTDGRDSLEDMARAAKALGWEWVALGDHSRSLTVAKGLQIESLRRTISEVRKLEKKIGGIRLMRSMEVDILKDGSMDYPDSVLDEIDVVIASVHSHFSMDSQEMTARIRRAAANPHVDIIGHLSGRRIGKREAYPLDSDAVLEEGAKHGAAFEINGQPERQDIEDFRARRAKELGIPLAVTTDAHSKGQFRYMQLAVTIARRAWLTKKDLINCMSYDQLRDWLARRRG